MKHFSITINPDGTTSVSHDPEEHRRWKAEKRKRPAPMGVRAWEPCNHRGIETGKTKGCLCGQRNKEIPVFWCNRFNVECTEDPTTVHQTYRVCKRCECGPWAELLKG